MYFLVRHLTNYRSAAFVSAIIYMFNGLINGFIVSGNPSILEPYSLIPFIFLSIIKAKKAQNPINYSIIAGTLLAFQVFSGGALMLVYTFLIIFPYLAFDAISQGIKSKIAKSAIIACTMVLILFGLSAVKLLPNMDFIKETNRSNGLSYQEYLGEDVFVFKDFFKIFVLTGYTSSLKIHLGFAAFILVISSFFFIRKRIVLYFLSLSVFLAILASGGFLAEIFFKYVPEFSKTRHIARVLFAVAFSASILAGYGFLFISNFIKGKFKFNGFTRKPFLSYVS